MCAPQVSLDMQGVDIVCINDFEGREQPVISLDLDDLHIQLELCADTVKGDASVVLRARFYNPSVLFWEPVIEPWNLSVDVGMGDNETPGGTLVTITTERYLYLDISAQFLQTISRTYSLLMSAEGVGAAGTVVRSSASSVTSSPYSITNASGVEIIADGGMGPITLPPKATAPIEIKERRREGTVMAAP